MMQKIKSPNTRITRLILMAIAFMSVGLSIELYLLDHYEGILQLIPIICVNTSMMLALALFKLRKQKLGQIIT